MNTEQTFEGFTVVNHGEPLSYFLVSDEQLKAFLIKANIFSSTRQVASRLLDVLSGVRDEEKLTQLFTAAEGDECAAVQEFGRVLKSERDDLLSRAAAGKAGGSVTFDEILYVFEKDELVVVQLGDRIEMGARIESVTLRYSFGMPYAAFAYKFVGFDGDKFRFADGAHEVGYFEGRQSFREHQIIAMSNDKKDELAVRGEKYSKLNAQPSHMQYSGNVSRVEWRVRQYRADGRVIVDRSTMKKIDPNYSNYHGATRSSADEAHMNNPATLACASPFVYGFSFAAKVWCQMLIDNIAAPVFRKDAFDKLVLHPRRKHIMKALVSVDQSKHFKDIVDGKGAGIIFLLAGPPGGGKTLSAEALSETLEKPLYMVSAGELGSTPELVEQRLRDVLDMAAIWNAILLIDECDIFLEKRTNEDIVRNALVAIFLRMLEYYQGILFLTTNRACELDGAVLSRISMALDFPALTQHQREKVWAVLAADHPFASLDIAELAQHPLNGREIKHCLRLALSLADFEGRPARHSDVAEMVDMILAFRQSGLAVKD